MDDADVFSASLQWQGKTALPSQLFKDRGVPMRFFVYVGAMRKAVCDLLEACGGVVIGSVHGSIPIRYVDADDALPLKSGPKTVYSHLWVLHSIRAGHLKPLDSYILEVASAKKSASKRTPARRVTAVSSSSVSSPDFTEDMDQAILRLARTNARELEAEPQSPVFWRKALKVLGFADCTWEDVRDRYLSIMSDVGEEDHQSGSSDGEDDLDNELDLEKQYVASESKLVKFLTASSTKPRIASRRLAEKMNDGDVFVAPPQIVDVRKDLMNGSKGHQVFGNADDKFGQFGDGVDHHAMSNGMSNGISNGMSNGGGRSAEEMVLRLARETGVSQKVALHGLLVCGGNASRARKYLQGLDMSETRKSDLTLLKF